MKSAHMLCIEEGKSVFGITGEVRALRTVPAKFAHGREIAVHSGIEIGSYTVAVAIAMTLSIISVSFAVFPSRILGHNCAQDFCIYRLQIPQSCMHLVSAGKSLTNSK